MSESTDKREGIESRDLVPSGSTSAKVTNCAGQCDVNLEGLVRAGGIWDRKMGSPCAGQAMGAMARGQGGQQEGGINSMDAGAEEAKRPSYQEGSRFTGEKGGVKVDDEDDEDERELPPAKRQFRSTELSGGGEEAEVAKSVEGKADTDFDEWTRDFLESAKQTR